MFEDEVAFGSTNIAQLKIKLSQLYVHARRVVLRTLTQAEDSGVPLTELMLHGIAV
jgi:hypothetical protein